MGLDQLIRKGDTTTIRTQNIKEELLNVMIMHWTNQAGLTMNDFETCIDWCGKFAFWWTGRRIFASGKFHAHSSVYCQSTALELLFCKQRYFMTTPIRTCNRAKVRYVHDGRCYWEKRQYNTEAVVEHCDKRHEI